MDPYAMGAMGSRAMRSLQFAPPKKKPSPWLYTGAVIAVVLVVTIGGGLLLAHPPHSGAGNSGGNFAASENLHNLSVTFASDDITIKSVQQAQTFPDDQQANDNGMYTYFIRLNFHEANTTSQDAIVVYDLDFNLVLPDGNTIPALSSEISLELQQEDNRDNWVDFGVHGGKVDLSKLTLILGSSGEQTMKVPLQSGANLSQYQSKTVNPAQHFTYDGMDWELKDATESLSYSGSQAETGKVYVIVDMIVNNNTQSDFTSTSTGFVTLHSGSTSTAPDILSSADNFYDIHPGTANVTGTWDFLTPAAPDGQYTLAFAASDANSNGNYPGQTVNFTIN